MKILFTEKKIPYKTGKEISASAKYNGQVITKAVHLFASNNSMIKKMKKQLEEELKTTIGGLTV